MKYSIIAFSLFLSFNAYSQQDQTCSDLFSASCNGPDGKNKYVGVPEKMKASGKKIITEAQQKSVAAMGYKSVEDTLKARFAAAGLPVLDNPDANAWRNIRREPDEKGTTTYPSGEDAAKVFKPMAECKKESDEIQSVDGQKLTTADELKSALAKISDFKKKFEEKAIQLYTADIPSFIQQKIATGCRGFDAMKKTTATSPNPVPDGPEVAKAKETCVNFDKVKREAIRLYRLEGSPEYAKEAEKFVRENKYFVSQGGNNYSSTYFGGGYTGGTGSPPTPEQVEIANLRNQLNTERNGVYNTCYNLSDRINAIADKMNRETMTEINTAKPAVEHIVNSFYDESTKQAATKLFGEIKSDIQGITSQFVKDPKKKTEILDGYDEMKFNWMTLPKDDMYKKGSKGVNVLDEEKSSNFYMRTIGDDMYAVFADPGLTNFTEINADYKPDIRFGKDGQKERVNMMPVFLLNLKESPAAFLAVLAHEVGHKIGPRVSKMNGYDLTSTYGPLLQCYQDPKSIKMGKGQEDETIADYISSEVLANELAKQPKEKRRDYLKQSMAIFCGFEADPSAQFFVDCSGTHPNTYMRVAGIYGANPNLRSVVGCDGEGADFKNCGLKDIKLIESAPTSAKTQKSTDSKPLKNSKKEGAQ